MIVRSFLFSAALLGSSQAQEIPYKPSEQFDITLDLSFKTRSPSSTTTFDFTESRKEYEKRTSASPKPYLVLKFKIISLQAEENRLKVYRDGESLVMSRKNLEAGYEFDVDVGFLDDVKDRVKGYLHIIRFYDKKRNEISRVVIEFDAEGNYLVNGEKRGRM